MFLRSEILNKRIRIRRIRKMILIRKKGIILICDEEGRMEGEGGRKEGRIVKEEGRKEERKDSEGGRKEGRKGG